MDYMVGYDGLHPSNDMAGRNAFVRYVNVSCHAMMLPTVCCSRWFL